MTLVAYARAELYASLSTSTLTLDQLVSGLGLRGFSSRYSPPLAPLLGDEERSPFSRPDYGADTTAEATASLRRAG